VVKRRLEFQTPEGGEKSWSGIRREETAVVYKRGSWEERKKTEEKPENEFIEASLSKKKKGRICAPRTNLFDTGMWGNKTFPSGHY